jgi:hypothetical protein
LVLGLDQCLRQAVEVAFDAFAQDVAVIAGEATRVIAGPEDRVVSLRDHYQLLLFFHGHSETMMLYSHKISRAFRMPLRLATERSPISWLETLPLPTAERSPTAKMAVESPILGPTRLRRVS